MCSRFMCSLLQTLLPRATSFRHLLEDKEVHLVVEIVENAVHEEELSWVAAVHHDRDQDRTLEGAERGKGGVVGREAGSREKKRGSGLAWVSRCEMWLNQMSRNCSTRAVWKGGVGGLRVGWRRGRAKGCRGKVAWDAAR